MTHERGERGLVGVEIGGRTGRHHVEQFAVIVLLARVGPGIGLDPLRYVVVLTVLPRAEPQQHKVKAVLAGLTDEEIHAGEVEGPFRRLNLLPVDRCFNGVGVHGLSGLQAAGSVEGQELELLIWPPSMRNGLPSTISAKRLSRFSI